MRHAEVNVEGARSFGWQAHRFTDSLNLRAALTAAGATGAGHRDP